MRGFRLWLTFLCKIMAIVGALALFAGSLTLWARSENQLAAEFLQAGLLCLILAEVTQ